MRSRLVSDGEESMFSCGRKRQLYPPSNFDSSTLLQALENWRWGLGEDWSTTGLYGICNRQ